MISVLSMPRRDLEVIARSACPSWRWITIARGRENLLGAIHDGQAADSDCLPNAIPAHSHPSVAVPEDMLDAAAIAPRRCGRRRAMPR